MHFAHGRGVTTFTNSSFSILRSRLDPDDEDPRQQHDRRTSRLRRQTTRIHSTPIYSLLNIPSPGAWSSGATTPTMAPSSSAVQNPERTKHLVCTPFQSSTLKKPRRYVSSTPTIPVNVGRLWFLLHGFDPSLPSACLQDKPLGGLYGSAFHGGNTILGVGKTVGMESQEGRVCQAFLS
jgi:hypothetical protein